jgi:hypothetical protein
MEIATPQLIILLRRNSMSRKPSCMKRTPMSMDHHHSIYALDLRFSMRLAILFSTEDKFHTDRIFFSHLIFFWNKYKYSITIIYCTLSKHYNCTVHNNLAFTFTRIKQISFHVCIHYILKLMEIYSYLYTRSIKLLKNMKKLYFVFISQTFSAY